MPALYSCSGNGLSVTESQRPTNAFYNEIMQEPEALRALIRAPQPDLPVLSSNETLLLTGMGASYHAAWAMSFYAHSLGLRASVIEAADLVNYSASLLAANGMRLVFVSQSGMSAEVAPLAELLPAGVSLTAVTNDPQSLLPRRASAVRLLHAGTETFVACKTYVNTLAALWLMIRQLGGRLDGSEVDTLARLADAVEALVTRSEAIAQTWIRALDGCKSLLYLGHGMHAATARNCAMMCNEWAKFPAAYASIAAYRHGFIESADADVGYVIFAPPGKTQASALALARELESYGARVVLVGNGSSGTLAQPPEAAGVDEYLSPLIDVIPAQLFAEAYARHRGIPPAFRHISKVTTTL
jgi:glucosamine--fructose-6-phosphate aminotransferase (isomerizing)